MCQGTTSALNLEVSIYRWTENLRSLWTCFFPVCKTFELELECLTAIKVIWFDVFSFGTASETLQTYHSVWENKDLFTQTKFTVPSYHLHEAAEIVSLPMLLYTTYYQLVQMIVFVGFLQIIETCTTVTQTFQHNFINHNEGLTALCWRLSTRFQSK